MISQKSLDQISILINPGRTLSNSNACEMSDAIYRAQSQGYKNIIVDMTELEFLSSAGIGTILGAVETSRQRGGDIILCNVPERILHILKVLDLCDYLTIKSKKELAKELTLEED